jgi:hypothetical protein
MNKQENPENDKADKLRTLLGRLDRKKAPWYFEASLMQRLAGESPAPKFRSIPSFALSGLAVLVVGTIVYVQLLGPGRTSPVEEKAVGVIDTVQESDPEPAQERPPDIRTEPAPEVELRVSGRGPSDLMIEPTIEAGLPPRLSVAAVAADSVSWADTLDTLQIHADSLEK